MPVPQLQSSKQAAYLLLLGITACREPWALGAYGLDATSSPQPIPAPDAATVDSEDVDTASTGTSGSSTASGDTNSETSGSETNRADAATPLDSGVPTGLPACLESAEPGPFNAPGLELGPTETATDWSWPAPVAAMEWDLLIERDVAPRDAATSPTGGYYWSYAFSFEQGVAGRLGLQTEGVYQADLSIPAEFVKMAVFWLSGPPIAAELGDIPYPDARVAETSAAGADWMTIHARFDWQLCHVYHMRFAKESTDATGNGWYGAWIVDTTDGVETFLGRMLLPADVGLLSPFSSARTIPFDFSEPIECAVTEPVSAIFGTPSAEEPMPLLRTNRFASFPRCATSRFTDFPNGVRHELAVQP